MEKNFKKGDLVTHLCEWDLKGTVTYRDAIVHSCGKKQMVLTDAETGEEMGRHFDPITGRAGSCTGLSKTLPRLTTDEAVTTSLELAELLLEERRKSIEDRRERALARNAFDDFEKNLYRDKLNELHEPRALKYSEARRSVGLGD